jgi:hypothetical protein
MRLAAIENFLESFFAIFFLLLALPVAYVFLIVKIAWELATAWYERIYENPELIKEDK